ncbi:MAG: hypothetical protein HZA00_15450 [Nitrospinae bacterium]|nr:hypothetical protein [Nitrospinota bacterium]
MAVYTLPHEAFELLEEALGEREKAKKFARAMESAIEAIDEKARESIVEKKEHIKIEVREDLKKELVTRELFEKRFNVVDEKFKSLEKEMNERFKSLNFKLNIFIAIALITLTFANPTFVKLIERLF